MPGVAGVASAADPASRGKALFNGPGGCASCHSVAPGVVLVGPSLAGVATTAVGRLQDPQYHGTARTAAEYLEESVLKPRDDPV
jgi:nitric oxide reductase subunit C